ncbi:hypothetical protein PVAND_007443 [Polypedilum vanderplanki]|uniref:Uncharacterized protein n=1 Tax=Polypedilum vanderplanki TaxID=319348 RepID=A0A9J6C6X4_POLVA|nr:hypothetical protein PVAND_007443 [Polypedilum vanderplanki]
MEITVPFASYKYMRLFAVFAGIIGIIQSLLWIGMSITAILGYYCSIDFIGTEANYGTILILTLYQLYIKGDCTPSGFPQIDFTAIESLDLLTPSTFNIWMYVILSLSFVWLLSSFTLVINVKKSNLRYANVFLYIWCLITFVIAMIDLVLFILFVIDYETILSHSYSESLNFAVSTSSILLSAQNVSGIMFSVALRGYILWLINLILSLYLFTQTFKIYDYNKLEASGANVSGGQVNQGFKSEEIQQHSVFRNEPIKAYDIQQANHPWYNYLTTDIPRARPPTLIRSTSANGLEENFQRRMTSAAVLENTNKTTTGNEVVLRNKNNNLSVPNRSSNINNIGYVQTPAPTFEAKPQLRGGILRNSRYQ